VRGGLLSVVAWSLLRLLAPGPAIPWTPEMMEAAGRMQEALSVVAGQCREAGIPLEPLADPNATCLVGPEMGELFTTLGQVEAKRTTLMPDMAGLLVHLLQEAGVVRGDTVAVGASGSFPGLLVATVAAVEVLGAHPLTVLSLGASSFGATRAEFHLLHLHELLREAEVFSAPAAAVSLGGSRDAGIQFEPRVRDGLVREVEERGLPLLLEDDLAASVAGRMELYLGVAPGAEGGGDPPGGAVPGPGGGTMAPGEPGAGRVAAFVNIGGSDTNMGRSPGILSVPPGLVKDVRLPPVEEWGVLHAMAARGVPVIHLLHIRGLAMRYGLPWDPLPLPAPGSTPIRDESRGKGWVFWLLTAIYLGALALVFRGAAPLDGGSGPGL
jgi:poly-gamma-glutamate system protein